MLIIHLEIFTLINIMEKSYLLKNNALFRIIIITANYKDKFILQKKHSLYLVNAQYAQYIQIN